MYINPNYIYSTFLETFLSHVVTGFWFRSELLYGRYKNVGLYTGRLTVHPEQRHLVVICLILVEILLMWSCSWSEFLTSGLACELVLLFGVDWVCGSLLLIYDKFWTKFRPFLWYTVGQRMAFRFIYFISSTWSWARVISLVTRLWVRCPSNYCLIPVRIDIFFSSLKCPYWLWDTPSPLFNWYRGLFLWGWKEPTCEGDHTPYLVLSLTMSGAVSAFTLMPSWHTKGQLHL